MYRKEEKHDVGSLVAAQNEVRPVTLWLAPFTHRLAGLVYTSMDTIQAYFTVQALPPVSFPDHFSPHGKNWSGERPIPFSFPPPECCRSNQVAW